MGYKVKNITKYYNDLKVLENISIDFEPKKTTCILGPSGCGKTTLLNIIGGITDKDSGEIIGFQDKEMSFIFQEDRLIEWKNVEDNVRFVLKRKMYKKQIDTIIDKYLKLVNLEEYKYYYPRDLSGGMRQKISILRAFAYQSKLLIMDEPFKSLDINSKQIVIEFFKELRKIEKRTCILVTHDIEEALDLSDKIVIFSDKPTKVKKIIDNIFTVSGNFEDKMRIKKLIERELTDYNISNHLPS
ncbi:ABC transporter ATP-binding protein [Schnuerera sp.]|uniref:ABC transporter ATP-binding protein n=1 Tax=Schnuerera sp. TaxID=2794844 RepID=UPI002BC7762A|nr:ATP-binding cassette domain-containing protein [Schnuerera sp.]HSH34738.1 ATP-binding cassette domain-containing protein [Schnuerera sp.]